MATRPSLCERIEKAFAHRQMPTEVVEPEAYIQFDSDVEDALTFAGKDWREITREHWSKHYCTFYFLSHEALAYYLPSLLIIPLADGLDHMDMAVDSLIHDLDRTPPSSPEDFPFECRLAGLTCDEYEAIKEWLLFVCERVPRLAVGAAKGGPGDLFGRAFDTICLLQKGL